MAEVNEIQFFAPGKEEDYTPGVAVTAGVPLEIGGKAAFANNDIAANRLGSIVTKGLAKVVKINSAFTLVDDIWWDADGDPFGGTAGDGAATNVKADGDFYLGNLRLAALDSDTTCIIRLNGITQTVGLVDPTDLPEVLVTAIAIIDALEESGIIAKT